MKLVSSEASSEESEGPAFVEKKFGRQSELAELSLSAESSMQP